MVQMALAILALLLCSAFFSASETAFTSANKIRMQRQEEEGDKKARLALDLLERYDHLLSTILIGNNIVNIGAATLGTVFFVALVGDLGVTVSTAVLTILTLILGEISPKTLAKQMPESIAKQSARPLYILSLLFSPFVFLFHHWQKFILRLFQGDKGSEEITEEELFLL